MSQFCDVPCCSHHQASAALCTRFLLRYKPQYESSVNGSFCGYGYCISRYWFRLSSISRLLVANLRWIEVGSYMQARSSGYQSTQTVTFIVDLLAMLSHSSSRFRVINHGILVNDGDACFIQCSQHRQSPSDSHCAMPTHEQASQVTSSREAHQVLS